MDVGLQVSGGYDAVVAAARWAEAEDFVAFALPDHYVGGLGTDTAATGDAFDGLVQLAGLARDTSRIELSMLVSPITFRHPAVLAKTAVTIDHMSGGRFTLGVGTGWLEREHEIFGFPFPERAVRFDMMEEALAYLQAAFANDAAGFAGRFFELEAISVQPKPLTRRRLVVGGMGSTRTPALAGRYADEYNVYPAGRAELEGRIRLMREAARAAGRDPDAILISSSGQVVTAETRDGYDEKLAARAAELGMDVDELEQHYAVRNTPRGSHDEVREQLRTLGDVGVTRFYLQRPAEFDREAERGLVAAIRSM